MKVASSIYEEEEVAEAAYTSWAEVYNVSLSDINDLKGQFAKNALALESIKSTAITSVVSVKIRDPLSAYLPRNSDTAILYDERYQGKKWEIIDIRPDFYNRNYLIIHLKGT